MVSPCCHSATPKAASYGHLSVCSLERERGEPLTQAFGVRHAGFEIRRFEQNRELFTAETTNDSAVPDDFAADGAKDLVADIVSIRVINPLEMVHIEHNRGQKF